MLNEGVHTNKAVLPKAQRDEKQARLLQAFTINELNFTYKRLMRAMPGIVRRLGNGAASEPLTEQLRATGSILEDLRKMASRNGHTPGPCVCDEASAVLEGVHHAERRSKGSGSRALDVVRALSAVHTFLIRSWQRLIGSLAPENDRDLRETATRLQHREADLHRQLVELGKSVGNGSVEGSPLW